MLSSLFRNGAGSIVNATPELNSIRLTIVAITDVTMIANAAACLLLFVNVAAAFGPNPIIDGGVERELLADPTLIQFNNTLYLYPTGDERHYEVYTFDLESDDDSWTLAPNPVFTATRDFCLPQLVPGAGKNQLLWAPHVFAHEG